MDEFLANAGKLLESARAAGGAEAGAPLSILIGHNGAIQAVSASDWPLDSLALEYGARMAFRISRTGRVVRVEGRQGTRRCLLEAETAAPVVYWTGAQAAGYRASLVRMSFT